MSHFEQHKEFFDKPIFLSRDQEKVPHQVIEQFFTDYRLSEIREMHEIIRTTCLTCDTPPFDDPTFRDRLILFLQHEIKLEEAAFAILQLIKNSPGRPYTNEASAANTEPLMGELDLRDLQLRLMEIAEKTVDVTAIAWKAWKNAGKIE